MERKGHAWTNISFMVISGFAVYTLNIFVVPFNIKQCAELLLV